jgi:hypothetical protein
MSEWAVSAPGKRERCSWHLPYLLFNSPKPKQGRQATVSGRPLLAQKPGRGFCAVGAPTRATQLGIPGCLGTAAQGRQWAWNCREGAGRGGGAGEPVELQGILILGSHTRPARPPEAELRRTAGGLHFLGGELR